MRAIRNWRSGERRRYETSIAYAGGWRRPYAPRTIAIHNRILTALKHRTWNFLEFAR